MEPQDKPAPGRFDYVKYDELAQETQAMFKDQFKRLELMLEGQGPSRPVSLALTALEESYMWCGKAIRDNQIARNARNASTDLQESRG